MPGVRAARAIRRIERSLRGPGVAYARLDIALARGVRRRPAVSVFLTEPVEDDGPVRRAPDAVVLLTPARDPGEYIALGVGDVLLLDPSTGHVVHFRRDGATRHASPHEARLECGCLVTV